MATCTTQWILDFADKVTKPVKSMANKVSDSIDKMSGRYQFSEKEARKALSGAVKYYKDLKVQIKASCELLKRSSPGIRLSQPLQISIPVMVRLKGFAAKRMP